MLVVLSSAYVTDELRAEFGKIPASFLPLGNRRLFQHQFASLGSDTGLITLPNDYTLNSYDHEWLDENRVGVLYIPSTDSLVKVLTRVLQVDTVKTAPEVQILFGDTLVSTEIDPAGNLIGLSEVSDNYRWAFYDIKKNEFCDEVRVLPVGLQKEEQVFCGYLKIKSVDEFSESLRYSNDNIVNALNLFNKRCAPVKTIIESWLDFGHLNTFYKSKTKYSTQRAFNELELNEKFVKKHSSLNQHKIMAEAYWFANVPLDIKCACPQLLAVGDNSYTIEYLYLTSLNELYVFGELSPLSWRKIINRAISVLKQFGNYETESGAKFSLNNFLSNKTLARLKSFNEQKVIDIDHKYSYAGRPAVSARELYYLTLKFLNFQDKVKTISHGDYCFSNLLFDFRADTLKVIDPRGIDEKDSHTIFGDLRYDIIKFAHSLIGKYDYIIANRYNLRFEGNAISLKMLETQEYAGLEDYFYESMFDFFGIDKQQILAAQIHLFLSMLPLHYDDQLRQKALLANAYRLYYLLLEEVGE